MTDNPQFQRLHYIRQQLTGHPAYREIRMVSETDTELRRIVKEYLHDDPSLYQIVDKISQHAEEALTLLKHGDETSVAASSLALESLEVIVDLDGRMPSFMIKNGLPDPGSSSGGHPWVEDYWVAARNTVQKAIRCVGRINTPGTNPGYMGTGVLVGPDLIMTNRHVLQVIADKTAPGVWEFRSQVHIDFGHEYDGILSLDPRYPEKVVFCPKDMIIDPIDHHMLDIVLIALKPRQHTGEAVHLPVNGEAAWAANIQDEVYIIGFPARPAIPSYSLTLLEQLFQSTFGCKRLAPGFITANGPKLAPWSMTHNATTLGGNSGSAVIHKRNGEWLAGLHYGGQASPIRQNFAHVLGATLDSRDESDVQFRDCLASYRALAPSVNPINRRL